MANKHVMDARFARAGPPARSANQPSWGPPTQKSSNRPAAPRSASRGAPQQRHREGRPRDVPQKSDAGEDDEDDYEGELLLDAYQDDRKGVLLWDAEPLLTL